MMKKWTNPGPVTRWCASFSGGKDSTAMVLRLIEEDWPLDEIVFFDTGWEFPEMYEHISFVEKYIEREIIRLKPKLSFVYEMLEKPIIARNGPMKGQVHRTGNGWPWINRRWCTRRKIDAIKKYNKGAAQYIGIAANEKQRIKRNEENVLYPLIKWNMSEADTLEYCKSRGFDWGGLYQHFRRVSCFCCPLQSLQSLRALRRYYPDLWGKMIEWESRMDRGITIRRDAGMLDLEARFAEEDKQGKLL